MQQHRILLNLKTIQRESIRREKKMFYDHNFDIESLFHAKFFRTFEIDEGQSAHEFSLGLETVFSYSKL